MDNARMHGRGLGHLTRRNDDSILLVEDFLLQTYA